MIFVETAVAGAYVVELEPKRDERGFFARTFSAREFDRRGLEPSLVECSVAFNDARLTLRGLHYQCAPHEETKLVLCTRGAVYDVVVDLRPTSPTYLRWGAVELTAENRRMLYVPGGCAHGYLTLEERSELHYLMSEEHAPESARGARWNDPRLAIEWPAAPAVISARDASYPDLELPH